uniref:SGNH domain-containing protein n=1 Tax=Panagrolaimus sp. ES5 TaxID=591445 RepID=A0AC34FE59_9BILA
MLVAAFVVGIFVHIFIEKPIIKVRMKPEKFLPLLIVAYLLIGIVLLPNNTFKTPTSFAKDIYQNKSKFILNEEEWQEIAAEINPDISAEIGIYVNERGCHNYDVQSSNFSEQFQHFGAIFGTELKGSGNLSVLVIGNSHAECVVPAIELAMEGQFSELNLFGIGGSTPFEGFKFSQNWFLLKEAVKHYKPDIIFFVFKYLEDFDDPPTEPIEKDVQTLQVQEMIDFLSKNSKFLFISEKF